MKKCICFSLVLIFCLMLFSCRKKEIPIEDNEEEFDFSGFVFEIYRGTYYEIGTLMPKKGETASGDRLLERYNDIKNETGLDINVISTDGIAAQVLGNLISGTDKIDMVNDRGYVVYDLYKANAVWPLEMIGVDDYTDEKWGTAALLGETTFGGTTYGFFPYYWDIAPRMGGMILCDMEGIERAGMTDPHEYIERGEWNWSAFRKELEKGTFIDENGTEHFGFVVDYAYDAVVLTFTAVCSNNAEPVAFRNGRYYSNLSDSRSVEAIEYLESLFHDGIARFSDTGTFRKNGPCPMMLYMVPDSQANVIVNGFIPFPYGPSGNSETVSAVLVPSGSHGSNLYFTFPVTSMFSTGESGYIADLLFDPLDPSRPLGWKDVLSESVFHYDSDTDNYIRSVEKVHAFGSEMINESYKEVFDGLYSALCDSSTVAEVLATIEPLLQNDLDNSVNKQVS